MFFLKQNFFPRRVKFLLIVIPLLMLVNLVSYGLYTNHKKNELSLLKNNAENRLLRHKDILDEFSKNIINDLKIILNHNDLQDLIQSNHDKSSMDFVHDLIQIETIERTYDQIRYIDENGMEKIRVNFNDGHPGSVEKKRLQNKKDRYYFKDTFKLNKNQIFISPMDLNIENGMIEVPIKPMIRIGSPVFDKDGIKKGILIVNYLSETLLNSLEDKTSSSSIMMLNRNGYFLKGMKKDHDWGFMYQNKSQITFDHIFPNSWELMNRTDKGSFTNEFGIFSFETVYPLKKSIISSSGASKAFQESQKKINSDQYFWKLVLIVSQKELEQKIEPFKRNLIVFNLALCLIIIIITWFLAELSYKKKTAELSLKFAYDELEKKVAQRLKELNCMYEMVKLSAANDLSIRGILKEATNIIPAGFPLSNGGICRISLDGVIVESDTFKSDSSVIQAPLIMDENYRGRIEVSFSAVTPDVDKTLPKIEEKALVESLAKQLSIIVSKKERDQEKEKLEAQLFQSQKMEAIGQLSGGIAHDFNNMLTIINGFAELGKLSVKADSDVSSKFEEILKAGNKAASLTRQLLAFSRKDSIQPKPFQINDLINNSLKLINRLVGEDIIKKIELDQDLPLIKADQSQIDQMLFNLVINARDAINAREGKHKKIITIATKVVDIKKEEVEQVLDIEDGTFVVFEVTDTGTGMSREIQKKVFTPFFSTKKKKNGTGLGLSTVYGIVKQNRGNINIYSEVGIGTTFRIYWPVLKKKESGVSIELTFRSLKIEKKSFSLTRMT
ncbi:MAG: hypothetical protein JEZ12_20570 [Desulfobacterium sp.]|nr:hypothetical protein [Desulfobacterium sp.]